MSGIAIAVDFLIPWVDLLGRLDRDPCPPWQDEMADRTLGGMVGWRRESRMGMAVG